MAGPVRSGAGLERLRTRLPDIAALGTDMVAIWLSNSVASCDHFIDSCPYSSVGIVPGHTNLPLHDIPPAPTSLPVGFGALIDLYLVPYKHASVNVIFDDICASKMGDESQKERKIRKKNLLGTRRRDGNHTT